MKLINFLFTNQAFKFKMIKLLFLNICLVLSDTLIFTLLVPIVNKIGEHSTNYNIILFSYTTTFQNYIIFYLFSGFVLTCIRFLCLHQSQTSVENINCLASEKVNYEIIKVQQSKNPNKHSIDYVSEVISKVSLFSSSVQSTSILITSLLLTFAFFCFLIYNIGFSIVYAFFTISLTYFFYHSIIKKYINKNSIAINNLIDNINKHVFYEVMNKITINLNDDDEKYQNKFKNLVNQRAKINVQNYMFGASPKYIIEFVGISFILIIMLINFTINDNSEIISTAGILLIGLQRLLPSIQTANQNYNVIKGNNKITNEILKILYSTTDSKRNFIIPLNTLFLDSVSFKYDTRSVINNFSAKFNIGETYVINGESGSGKSTLIKLILGILSPDKGKVIIDDNYHKNFLLGDCFYISQEFYIEEQTVYDFLEISNKVTENHSLHILAELNLTQLSLKTIIRDNGANLSGGQRQRLFIAKALLSQKNIYIYDEITSGLDLKSENLVLDMINKYKSNSLIIFITHSSNIINKFENTITIT